jgi:stage II sporulation protein M
MKHYGVQAFLITLFVLGLFVGAAGSFGFETTLSERLDFLFVTNIKARLGMTAFGIFSSCFVSYFLFILLLFLFAFSAWGFCTAPLLTVFKGFSVGLSSAFIVSAYGASGIGFYILIILPGTVCFLFTLIRYTRDAIRLSLRFGRLCLFGGESSPLHDADIRLFLKKSLFAFLFSGACAVIDMVLWALFADKFHFV